MAKKNSLQTGVTESTVMGLVGFGAGVALTAGLAVLLWYTQPSPAVRALRQSDLNPHAEYHFTDPLIGLVASTGTETYPQFQPLQDTLQTYLANEAANGLVGASVEVRDIVGQARLSVGAGQIYTPASLYKVPLMMAYYQLAETDPSVLSQELVYTGAHDLDQNENIRSTTQLAPGESYTIEELITHMIRYSDNNADQLLLEHLLATKHEDVLTDLFNNLHIPFGSLTVSTDLVTPEQYILFLRVLYNATYLDRDYSEKALSLLSQTDFNGGIVAGVPSGLTVAHKFGDANFASGDTAGKELHDCGIVYLPGHPYMLCVMTKGSTVAELSSVIKHISQLVYQDMATRYGVSK